MRNAIGIFGCSAGAAIVALVVRYGFVTSDTNLDGAIVGFFFAVIAIGGIAGPAVAVHLFRALPGWAKSWGVVAGVVAAVALVANLSNSLGAIAGRADKVEAERAKAADTSKDARAELKRITSERAALPAFRPATAVEADLEAARAHPRFKASNGCDPIQVTAMQTRENCEQFRKLEAELATAHAATKLEGEAASWRAALAAGKPVASANPLADALSRILSLPADLAATWQQAATVIVVELVVAFALIAFELLAVSPHGTEAKPTLSPAPAPQRRDVPAIEPPRLSAADATSIARFMPACLPRASGERVSWGAAYARYQRWCSAQEPSLAPLGIEAFGEQFCAYCDRADINTRKDGSKLYCLDVRLVG